MNKDKEMILNPLEWPVYPRLPLKRPNATWFDPAYLVASSRCMTPMDGGNTADPDKPFTIILGLVFGDKKNPDTKTYPNVDALLADGWIVD